MRIFFDTEFIEDGKTIDLISIGMVREDDSRFYAEPIECDRSHASVWVQENVLPRTFVNPALREPRAEIAKNIAEFVGKDPEFWGYYADYDWVALCQLYGTMMDLPESWPMFCLDIKQYVDYVGTSLGSRIQLPKSTGEHNALADAKWIKSAYSYIVLKDLKRGLK